MNPRNSWTFKSKPSYLEIASYTSLVRIWLPVSPNASPDPPNLKLFSQSLLSWSGFPQQVLCVFKLIGLKKRWILHDVFLYHEGCHPLRP